MGGVFGRHTPLTRVPYAELDLEIKTLVDQTMVDLVRICYERAEPCGYKFRTCAQCVASNDIKVTVIPVSAWRTAVGRATTRPYILSEAKIEGTDEAIFTITFIHNLHTVATTVTCPPPTPILARAAVAQALTRNDICAISHEPLADLTDFRVGCCGHVFGVDAARFNKCPLCMAPVAWCSVSRTEL
jgi:hypothetical protein